MHPEMMASSSGGDIACGIGGGDCPQQPAITTSSGCGGALSAGGAGGPKHAERTTSS